MLACEQSGTVGVLFPCVIMVAQSLNFSCGFCFLLLIMARFAHILSAYDGQPNNLIARNNARILQFFFWLWCFSAHWQFFLIFCLPLFCLPGLLFELFERTRIVLFKLIFYKDYMQTQRAEIAYCVNPYWLCEKQNWIDGGNTYLLYS